LPFLISRYYYPCIYIWVNFAFKAMFLSSSGTRESFILLQYRSKPSAGDKGNRTTGRSEFHERTLLEFYFRFSTSNLPASTPVPLPQTHTFSAIIMSIPPLQETRSENVIQSASRTRRMSIGFAKYSTYISPVGNNGTLCWISCARHGPYCVFCLEAAWKDT